MLLLLLCICNCGKGDSLEPNFNSVCQALIKGGWLSDDFDQSLVSLDYNHLPYKHLVATKTEHVELILTEDNRPYQYGFRRKLDSIDEVKLFIEACSTANADFIAQKLYPPYERSRIYLDEQPELLPRQPYSVFTYGDIRYILSGPWFFAYDLQLDRLIAEMNSQ